MMTELVVVIAINIFTLPPSTPWVDWTSFQIFDRVRKCILKNKFTYYLLDSYNP